MTTTFAQRVFSAPTVYAADAFAAAGLGVVLMALAAPLTDLAGWAIPAGFLFWLGLFLVPWGAFNLWSARQSALPGWAFTLHMAVDGAWVLGSLLLLALEAARLTPIGMVLLNGQGAMVLGVLLCKRLVR